MTSLTHPAYDFLTPKRARWDQRVMAGLAVLYVPLQYLVLEVHDYRETFVVYALAFALPQVARRNLTFSAACAALGVANLLVGAVLAVAGVFIFWPASLPLLLAPIRIPERWTLFVTPVLLALVIGLLAAAAYGFSIWTW